MIAEARTERGLTQAELASDVNIDRTYLARLESGRSTIQIQRVLDLLRALGVTIEATLEAPGDDG
jgi:transcriptional regulator with XRE-family HTH domain